MIDTILCDTDFLIALLIENDTNHTKARYILDTHISSDFIYSNLTEYELMTVLSRKLPQDIAIQAYNLFTATFTSRVVFELELEKEAVALYRKSTNKNQSFFDIACLVTAKKHNYKIASFDRFYPNNMLVNNQSTTNQ